MDDLIHAPLTSTTEASAVLTVAFLLDRLGEPPTRWHPVGWIGELVAQLERGAPTGARAQLVYGALLPLAPALLAAIVTWLLEHATRRLPPIPRVIAQGALLTWTMSLAGLERAAHEVSELLEHGRLGEARQSLRALVSRDTRDLGPPLVAAAAIESVAENASDSVIAPLFWWWLAGLPGAAAYRACNTADAMVGYHGRYEHLGKCAARLDDFLNIVPARLGAAALCLASGRRSSLRTLLRDHAKTESPNAGWPMSAIAGALGRRLSKADYYSLGDGFPEPGYRDVRRAVRLVRRAVVLCVIAFLLTPRRVS